MTTRLHNCAAEGCDKQIAINLLMCMAHWRLVPRPLQRDVYRTFRALLPTPDEVGSGPIKAYRAAVKHAINAVREKEIKRALRNDQHGDTLDLQARD